MNVTRICELAAVLAACRHEDSDTLRIGEVRWCMRCGAVKSANATWVTTITAADLVKHLATEETRLPTLDVLDGQLPLPLKLRRRRKRA